MTKRLILTRHAKSSWNSPGSDHDRPLNKRGYASAPAIGNWLRGKGYVPDEILSSSARRTVETCEGLRFEATPVFLRNLYLASSAEMLSVLQASQADRVLMVGHNPGIGDLAWRLAAAPFPHPRFRDYPTCATTVFDFDVSSWQDVNPGTGQILDFVIPREL